MKSRAFAFWEWLSRPWSLLVSVLSAWRDCNGDVAGLKCRNRDSEFKWTHYRLNPSTADEFQDDPTVRRCKDFARREGCGGLVMTNIFAFRDTDPKGMLKHDKPIGEKCWHGMQEYEINDVRLFESYFRCRVHIAAWGVHGSHMGRGRRVAKLFPFPIQCLGITKDGHPKHPLYLSKTTAPIPYP